MATGYLPIGSCSRRVPQAGAAVPRTGNVPGADLEALPSKDTAHGGGGRTHTQEEARLKRRVQTLQRRGIGVYLQESLPAHDPRTWLQMRGMHVLSWCTVWLPGLPLSYLYLSRPVC